MKKPEIRKKKGFFTVTIKPEPKKTYKIFIGQNLLSEAGSIISKKLPKARAAIITDENVAQHHLLSLSNSLKNANIEFSSFILPPGEKTKSYEAFYKLSEKLLSNYYKREDVIIALGGGVIGDLAGFIAGTLGRGMHFIQIPTSLLAQVDSSIGGKTGINTKNGKNLIGLFYQPQAVITDTEVLNTLPERIFRDGYAEIIKYGIIRNLDFFSWIEKNWKQIFTAGENRKKAIETCCLTKAEIIEQDERDKGIRMHLNFGHTFAHALEAATEYDTNRLMHGESVAIGMMLACQFSEWLNLTGSSTIQRIESHLKAVNLPWKLNQIPGSLPPPEILLDYMMQDKKNDRSKFTFILIQDIGKVAVRRDIFHDQILSFFKEIYP